MTAATSDRTFFRPVLDYDDPVPDAVTLDEPVTPDLVTRLTEQAVSCVKIGAKVPADGLALLAQMPALRGIDFGWGASSG